MHICYVDESGDAYQIPVPTPMGSPTEHPPVFVLLGLILNTDAIGSISTQFLEHKARYYPGLVHSVSHRLDSVLVEIKSTDLRKAIRDGSGRAEGTAIGFLDRLYDTLDSHAARVLARVLVKPPGQPIDARAVYTSSMQALCRGFQQLLEEMGGRGLVIADSRTHQLDERVAHSLYTLKHRAAGDALDRIVEVPTFGRSGNHVGLQLADLVGGVLLAIAARTYCQTIVSGPHVAPQYDMLRRRYGPRLRSLQYRYQDDTGRWRGGVTVNDPLGKRSASDLFAAS